MKQTKTLSLSFLVLHQSCVSVHELVACTQLLTGEDTDKLLLVVVTYTMIIYSVGCVRKQPVRDQTESTESWLACGLDWDRGRDARGRHRRWESGHGKQHVRAGSKKFFLFPDCLHTLSLCLCTSACVRPPIHLESCDSTRVVMHSVKSPAINSRTVLGFPVKYCRSPVMFKESAYLCSVMFYVLWVLRVL